MKKFLLLSALISVVASANAQSVSVRKTISTKEVNYVSHKAPLMRQSSVVKKSVSHRLLNVQMDAPRISPVNFVSMRETKKQLSKMSASTVAYGRPMGVWYLDAELDNNATAIVSPVLTGICYSPLFEGTASWSANGKPITSDIAEIDEDGLWIEYPVVAQEDDSSSFYFAPRVSDGVSSYGLVDYVMVSRQYESVSHINSVCVTSYLQDNGEYIYGSNSYLEKTLKNEGKEVTAMCQMFEAPASAACFENLYFYFGSKQADPLNGKTLTAKIYRLDENQEDYEGDPVYTLTCNSAEYFQMPSSTADGYGALTFNNYDKEGEAQPFIIDFDFAVSLEGYHQEGVDVNFFSCNQAQNPGEIFEGAFPVCLETADELLCNMSLEPGNVSIATVYMGMNMFYDVATVVPGSEKIAISADGKSCWTYGTVFDSEDDFGSIWIQTSDLFFIEEDQNYFIDDCPDWLDFDANGDDYYNEIMPGLVYLIPKATALPNGVSGRKAVVHVTSDFGAVSEDIVVIQGEPDTSIETLATASSTCKPIYNLSGQKVTGKCKGLVVRGGKKIFLK